MDEKLQNEVIAFLKKQLYANLATVSAENPDQPHVATVAYVNDGLDLYFVTKKQTRKFTNLEKNSRVSLTIDTDEPDWMRIKGIQMEGEAEVVQKENTPFAFGLLTEKYPLIRSLPPDPDYRFIHIKPKRIWFLDYQKCFGHREYLEV